MKYLVSGYKFALLIVLICIAPLHHSCEKSDDPEFNTPLGTVSDYDGNSYYTKQLGDQWWMINNLRTTHYADGTALPLIESIAVWDALGNDEKAYCQNIL